MKRILAALVLLCAGCSDQQQRRHGETMAQLKEMQQEIRLLHRDLISVKFDVGDVEEKIILLHDRLNHHEKKENP